MEKPIFGFEELFEEFPKSSHSRDDLLKILGFLCFESFPSEKSCVHCVDVMNVFFIALIICLSLSANFKVIC